ncbi:hypothetical protein PGT21_012573 [Puccinia graminis f. sp. tritici]|uniref:Uncharacterized protein n=1 Tax=Puccinia graminis f. sp. tritici TaxID=56615 RepID=A0A5B0QEY9_PUCGR|nr:hypothetical protein PGT21_012573 [Puccinia graminis f. sp. tritici]
MGPLFQGQRTPTLTPRSRHPRPAPYRSRSSIINPNLALEADLITKNASRPHSLSTPSTQSATGQAGLMDDPNGSGEESDSDVEDNLYPNTTAFVARLDLELQARDVAAELSSMPLVRREATIFCTLASLLQRMERLENRPVLLTSGVPAPPPEQSIISIPVPSGGEATFVFGRRFKANSAHRFMLRPDLDAYTQGSGANAPNPEQGLLSLILGHINNQDAQFHRQHLPPGSIRELLIGDNDVVRLVKGITKHVRNKARNILLTGILQPAGLNSNNNIPNIHELSRLLWKHLTRNPRRLTELQIDAEIDPTLKVRFAYLRMATISNYMDPNMRNVSQWDTIDAQLALNRCEPADYTAAWRHLISERDHELFADSPNFEDLDLECTLCPTEEEINDAMTLIR